MCRVLRGCGSSVPHSIASWIAKVAFDYGELEILDFAWHVLGLCSNDSLLWIKASTVEALCWFQAATYA